MSFSVAPLIWKSKSRDNKKKNLNCKQLLPVFNHKCQAASLCHHMETAHKVTEWWQDGSGCVTWALSRKAFQKSLATCSFVSKQDPLKNNNNLPGELQEMLKIWSNGHFRQRALKASHLNWIIPPFYFFQSSWEFKAGSISSTLVPHSFVR